ncbi:MAG TPA: SRPBCC domain-containing protein [Rhizomicrobium sp.]|nr:SRPBCC domain-containing protein [Rhizomicrobium sp.]
MDNLPRFIDRWTIEYVHTYPHPIGRVWRAITDPKEFGVWFIRGSLDLRAGGAYEFETGDDGFKGKVLELEAPRYIRFGGPTHEKGYFQYELAAFEGGTRMRFVQHFPPESTNAWGAADAGGDIPVRGTPWKPGFVGGWYEFWDALGAFLDGAMDPEEQRQQRWRELNVFFRAWIVENCPPD